MDATTTEQDALFAGAARKLLGSETLETRNSDRLDFHEIAVSRTYF
jgi:hypothetical protein